MSTDSQYMVEEIKKKLLGGHIKQAISGTDEGDAAFGFIVQMDDREIIVWVDRDAEANGPGWLDIVE